MPLVNGEIYHILNRGVAAQPIFLGKHDYRRALESMFYYQNIHLTQRYSLFLTQARVIREEVLEKLRKKSEFLVEILAYCLMPNHFHLLLRQVVEGGVSRFLSNFTNSYSRYFNTRYQREGPLLQGKFKAVRVETDNQLLHLSRYIHLNPHSSYVVKTLDRLVAYPYSSLGEYLGENHNSYCQKEAILNFFKNIEAYQKFIFDQADYQRRLDEIKHLTLEKP